MTLTKKAAEHIISYTKPRNALGVRLDIKTSGCNGFTYVFETVYAKNPTDLTFKSKGVSLFLDPKNLDILNGTVIDYIQEKFKGGFDIINPNIKATCGCGESFTV